VKKITFNSEQPINGIKSNGKVKNAKEVKEAKKTDEEIDAVLSQSMTEDEVVAGRAIYDEIYGRTQQQISRLWKTIMILIAALIVAIIWLGVLSNASKVELAVIHTNGNNQILSVSRASQLDRANAYPELNTYILELFVKSARRVTVDGILQSTMMKEAFAFTQGQATKALTSFYKEKKPDELLKTNFIEVEINTILPNIGGSDKTTQITWTEIRRDNATNQVISRETYTGQFSFRLTLTPPENERIMLYNPFGFYITHISWTRDYSKDQGI